MKAGAMFQRVVLPTTVQRYLDENELDTQLSAAMNETTSELPEDPFGTLTLKLAEKMDNAAAEKSSSSSSSSSSSRPPCGVPSFGKVRVVEKLGETTRRLCEVVMSVRGAPVRIHSFGVEVRPSDPVPASSASGGDRSGSGSGTSTAGEWQPTVEELEAFAATLFQSGRTNLKGLGVMFLPDVLESFFPDFGRPGTAASQLLSGSEQPGSRPVSAVSRRSKQSFSVKMQGNLLLAHSKVRSGETVFETLVNDGNGGKKCLALPPSFCGCVQWKIPSAAGEEAAESAGGGEEELGKRGLPFFGVALPADSPDPEAAVEEGGAPVSCPLTKATYARMRTLAEKVDAELKTKVGEVLIADEASGGLTSTSLEDAFPLLQEAVEAAVPGSDFSFVLCIPETFTGPAFPIPEAFLQNSGRAVRIFGSPTLYEPFDVEKFPKVLQCAQPPVAFESPLSYAQQCELCYPKGDAKFGYSNSLFVECADPLILEAEFPFLDVLLASNCAVLRGGFSEAMEERFNYLLDTVPEELLPPYEPVLIPMVAAPAAA